MSSGLYRDCSRNERVRGASRDGRTGSSLQGGHNASSNVCSGQKRPLWIHCYLLASCIYEECDSLSHGRGGSRSELSVVCQAWVGLSLHFSPGMK